MGSNLLNRSFPIQSLQNIDQATLDAWRATYIASNGTLNPATQQVPNPFQPATGPRLPFAGPLAAATIAAAEHAVPVSAADRLGTPRSTARARRRDYHSLTAAGGRRLSAGLTFDASYTFSREMRQHRHASRTTRASTPAATPAAATTCSTATRNHAHRLQRHAAPLRRRRSSTSCRSGRIARSRSATGVLRAIARDWQVSGSLLWHSGFPVAVNGASTGAIVGPAGSRAGRRLRAAGQPAGLVRRTHDDHAAERPPRHAAGQHATCATTRTRSPAASSPRRTARIIADQFWYGNAELAYDEIRTDPRFNIDLSIRRTFRLEPVEGDRRRRST